MWKRDVILFSLLIVVVVGAAIVGQRLWVAKIREPGATALPQGQDFTAMDATYVGRTACIECHVQADSLWQGSHHDLAMAEPGPESVVADFDNTSQTHFGVTSTFSRRDGKYYARTDGPDGEMHEYEIAYAFGVEPLQQFLIAFPDGRLQALNVCWDTWPDEEGGQRWFHLYPDEEVPYNDLFHWTGMLQNWNFMCAECHSTNLQKNYDPVTDTYSTTWSEINVSCEACHGPSSRHVAYEKALATGIKPREDPLRGLVFALKSPGDGVWMLQPDSVTARRSEPLASRVEAQTCARCHSRRGVIDYAYEYGKPYLDFYRLSLLDETLYHNDGQNLDEVYVYGSFLQSKMYREGVTCTDCHNPHSMQPYAAGDDVCDRCHLSTHYATVEHHHHKPDSTGANCLDCHMQARKVMVVDPRRDHSFRIPRPDLTQEIGTPNACSDCHADSSLQWVADAYVEWYGPGPGRQGHYGEALHMGFSGHPGAGQILLDLVGDSAEPGIARATALSLLGTYGDFSTTPELASALTDPDALVRAAAVRTLTAAPPERRLEMVWPLLSDPVRLVRIDAARVLAAQQNELTTAEQETSLSHALAEYRHAQLVNAERPESHLNLGMIHLEQGDLDAAEIAFRKARDLVPYFAGSYVNLADLYRMQGKDALGEEVLREGLVLATEPGDIQYALGLNLVRNGRLSEALEPLRLAAEQRPDNARYSYVYAVALQSSGEIEKGLQVLESAHTRRPHDVELMVGLVTLNRQAGDLDAAVRYAEDLVTLVPEDPGLRQMLDQLRHERDG